jgi:uncharacterized protein (DUF305 family)
MYSKNIGIALLGILAGYIAGTLSIGTRGGEGTSRVTGHVMPNGQMMNNSEMKGMNMESESMSMESMMQSMSLALTGKKDAAFDNAFLKEMIPHHQGAVVMAEQVLTSTKRPELIQLAHAIISAQNTEIRMMQKWQKEWNLTQ